MISKIESRSHVRLGVVPTHIKFVGGLVPNERGELPKDESGEILLISRIRTLIAASPVRIEIVQLPFFEGVQLDEVRQVLAALAEMNVQPLIVLMLAGGNPMLPEDENSFVAAAVKTVSQARDLNAEHLSSTSLEAWMQPGAQRRDGVAFEAAVAQVAKVHQRIYEEAELEGSCVKHWHIEFLREGEFSTFTDIRRGWDAVKAANGGLGKPFFKVLVDAAHCGDSRLSIDENAKAIEEIAAADELGLFHASAKTTRGCFSTDDGWIGAILNACAQTGKLQVALAEMFVHDDEALAGLRALDPGHGIDTTDGRTYDQMLIDGLVDVSRRLNNFVQRGILPPRASG